MLTENEIAQYISSGKLPSNGTPARSWVGIPLKTNTSVIGLLAITNFENTNVLSASHLELLNYIAPHITQFIGRRQSEEALKFSENQLRESNISKDKFFSIIAHDLRGPFNAIIGFSDLLYNEFDSFDESEKKAMIKNIYDASLGTFKLLENLLEWSRIKTGRSIPSLEYVDLSTIANACLSLLRPQAEKKNIKLFSGIHFGSIAYCDENMIKTVIRNILSNAIKFSQIGGFVKIWANLKEEWIEVIVTDNGVGIANENLGKLFQLDESVKTKGTMGETGTGLGLILCHEFIELNGGSIKAESEPGKGCQISFTIPKYPL
ncbi:MAG: GAF domain-containing sensor histidine kinase [Bacteroidales bacterium]|nr:GAF domain-containing sensor histidine kinase [Bacteroidales bacterium]